MKCKETYTWLLGAESPAEPIAEVRLHLRRCADCRRRQERLALLDDEVRDLPAPEESDEARLGLFRRLDQAPLPAATQPILRVGAPPGEWGWRLSIAAAVAASILAVIGLGWWFQPGPGPGPGIVTPPPVARTGPRDATVARIFEGDLRLAQTTAPDQQLRVLIGIAADLRAEALHLARQGSVDDLRVVGGLYERVVAQGLVSRALFLRDDEKRELLPALAQDLEAAADEAERLAGQSGPAIGQQLRALGAVARTTAQDLANPAPIGLPAEWIAPIPVRPGSSSALLGTLVVNGLRLAEERDPIRRADYCGDIANNLLLTLREASAAGDSDQATRLGKHLSDVINWGVATNLALVEGNAVDALRQVELDRVLQKGEDTAAAIVLALEKAPEPAKPALVRALESSKGKGKAKGHFKPPLPKGK